MIEIEGYEDFEVIGRGGFATVYKARQVSVGRHVAIKLLSDPSPDADLVRRFERESKAVGALSWHPHIAAVVDAGTTADGQAYIVFELLTGGSLDDHIDEEPLTWQTAVTWMIQVADAVEAAHHQDVLHRDIKPANILVNRLGDAKLADFGIASMQDGNKTDTGMLATTVSHAAPELFDGAPSSQATDIYALGSTMHNLVTGRPPFNPTDGEAIATIIKRVALEPPPRPDPSLVPPQLSAAIAHALAKQPGYRPRTAAAFGKALQSIQREYELPITAMPVADAVTSEPESSPTHDQPSGQASAGYEAAIDPTPPSAQTFGHDSGRVDTIERDATRTVGGGVVALMAVVVLLAAGLGGALAFRARTTTDPPTVTAGGAVIIDHSAGIETQMSGFPAVNAIDGDDATYWGIEPDIETGRNIVGTTFTFRFDTEVTISQLGVSNGTSTDLGRVSQINWGTSVADFNQNAPTNVLQEIPDSPGVQLIDVQITTDRLALAIVDVHDGETLTAGIAEILIEVE